MREASARIWACATSVQLIGGMALHQGRIAEMKTGEGKTLVSTLPAYLNALTGKGVHIVTVNDYLAKRDSEWMGKVYSSWAERRPVIQNDMPPRPARLPTRQTSPTAPTPSSVSTTCATTWSSGPSSACSAAMPSPSSTRSTPS